MLRTMIVGLILAGTGGTAAANVFDVEEERHLSLLDAHAARTCAFVGTICFAPGDRTTVQVASAAFTAAARPGVVMPAMPRFARNGESGKTPWTLDLSARLLHPSLAGNLVFLIYDADDPQAVANREVTVLFQTPVGIEKTLAARLSISPEDGIHPGHSYRIRVVQIVKGQERLLAEGDVALK